MEVLVKLPEDLYKYFEYIPVESLPDVIQDLVRSALQMKLESGLEDNGQAASNEMLQSLLTQISTIAGNSDNSNIIQKKLSVTSEVGVTKKESDTVPTEVKYLEPDVCSEDDDGDDLDDFFK